MRLTHARTTSALLSLSAAVLLAGCAATEEGEAGSTKPAAAATSGTWSPATQAQLAELMVGNTIEEKTGRWAVYYAPDGTKTVWVRDGETRKRKWRIDEDGNWCGTLYRDNREVCSPKLQVNGALLRKTTQYGSVEWTASIASGNPRKL